MKPLRIPPTLVDREIAGKVARHTRPGAERVAETLTWGADEHLVIACAAAFWLLSRGGSDRLRMCGTHLLAVSVATSVLPHALKYIFNQRRPDRLTVIGHLHGIPVSGRPNDAFPSGHAMHMGALAGAASALPLPYRAATWIASIGLSFTRIVVLAHWTSDVVAGYLGGFLVERIFRRWTGYGRGRCGHG
ncbi:phosphatase PAP2 family protein [Rhodopseudomonas boonkerdii]|uniref:phosphatase PAP2 family protein n=1 Tax=Rhodopseudomonas boonkerdii TaxID=475937 RepID=UPI001E5214A9|nr:phosphatase PAP2 family protein [Rhodopseudomonas boonkerdii]UGV24697.1 phosphatase PAP2 family protein [Rhodopseudomonas boonkerdii]